MKAVIVTTTIIIIALMKIIINLIFLSRIFSLKHFFFYFKFEFS